MTALQNGSPSPLGATVVDDGVNFAVRAGIAEAVELCLVDSDGNEYGRMPLPGRDGDTWHGFLPDAGSGLHYGYRVRGPWNPAAGLRCNPNKRLIDPYARALAGEFRWHDAVHDYAGSQLTADALPCSLDSGPYVPLSVVTGPAPPARTGPRIPWSDTVIYELNVRGYTMRHPALSEHERGRFHGLSNGAIVDYLKALGISSVELLPVHSFIDEAFLVEAGRRNFWGYNTLNFFTPAARYADQDARAEFIDMVNALHDAGLEVILDVVYNHSAEGDQQGPTICFRGFDQPAWYRLEAGDPLRTVNDTGCGNTLDADSPAVRALVVDSLRYWAADLGVDGFRFDLAPILGRSSDGFRGDHPLLQAIVDDPVLRERKLIAEPWDVGPGGYQLGAMPSGFAEWNDRYRDSVRRFWRGDAGSAADFAASLHGSSDLFEATGRAPWSSINFITSHDGYTLADLVSFEERHNHANGEDNRDGHRHNYSRNHGVEGPTDDPAITALRRQQRQNLLATLFLSQGTPMLLAGDEFGHSQAGNNNVYAQDNDIGWLDWSGLANDAAFQRDVAAMIHRRREHPLLRCPVWLHATEELRPGWPDIVWLKPDGREADDGDWHDSRSFAVIFGLPDSAPDIVALAILVNSSADAVDFTLAGYEPPSPWQPLFATVESTADGPDRWTLPPHALLALTC